MTIAKYIECEVAPQQRSAISHCQQSWAMIAQCHGFVGQSGGWEANQCTAIIIGIWQSLLDMNNFMETTHDKFTTQNKQSDTYLTCRVHYFRLVSADLLPGTVFSAFDLVQATHYCASDINLSSTALAKSGTAKLEGHCWAQLGKHVMRDITDHRSWLDLNYCSSTTAEPMAKDYQIPEIFGTAAVVASGSTQQVIHNVREWDVIPTGP